jgi:hypothetical protein
MENSHPPWASFQGQGRTRSDELPPLMPADDGKEHVPAEKQPAA